MFRRSLSPLTMRSSDAKKTLCAVSRVQFRNGLPGWCLCGRNRHSTSFTPIRASVPSSSALVFHAYRARLQSSAARAPQEVLRRDRPRRRQVLQKMLEGGVVTVMRVPVIVPCTLCCKLRASSYWLMVNVPAKLFPFGPRVTFS
jgi:hypothetical protein